MDDQKLYAILNDREFAQKVANQFFDLWINPEVIRRQEAGELERPLDLRAAQVILFPDERMTEVRINTEVKVFAKPKYVEGVTKQVGDAVLESELAGIEEFYLTEEDDPDCGFVVVLKFMGTWLLYFDFRYNKELARKHLALANQFVEGAEFAFQKGLVAPFIDNLFSAAELAVKAILLPHDPTMRKNKRHDRVQEHFNNFAELGNVELVYRDTFNKLRSLRNPARYADLNTEISVSDEEKESMLKTVKEMLQFASQMTSVQVSN